MIKKNIKKYALFCLIAVLACTMGILVHTPLNEVKGGTYSFEIENVQDVNRVGTEIILESEVEVEYNGSVVKFTNGSITYPNGKTYGIGKHKLNDIGNYSVKYYYKDGNVIVTAEKVILITNKYYDVTSGGSITTVTAEESVGKVLDVNSDNVLINNTDGLIVRMPEGSQFVYNVPIDLSKAGEDGIADIITLSYRFDEMAINKNPKYDWMYTTQGDPSSGIQDRYYYEIVKDIAARCRIRLTDAYDPTNYIELDEQRARMDTDPTKANFRNNHSMTMSAAAVGQALSGCRSGKGAGYSSVDAEILGSNYIAYLKWDRGAMPGGAYLTGHESQLKGISWGYDYKNNIVYGKAGGGWSVITELDNLDIYPGNPFKGFTTGEVYLSIYCTDYTSPSDGARIDIMSINGVNGKELVDMYEQSGRVDYNAPEITINYEPTIDNTIYAPFGSEVDLPTAFVKEIFSDRSYGINVYTNYGTKYATLVTTKNNKLKLDQNKIYTIEYSSTDTSGQSGKAYMNICPVYTEKAIWVDTEKLTSVDAGAYVTLPEFEIKTINSAEKVKYSVKVVGEKETFEFNSSDYIFRANYTGKYKVVYEYSDNAYSDTYSYEFDVVGATEPKFLSAPALPRYVVSGEKYNFNELKAYKYTDKGTEEVSADAYISVDGGAFAKLDNINGYKITATDNIKVKFVSGNVESEISEAKVISNKNENGVFRMNKYFVGDFSPIDKFNDKGRPTSSAVTYVTNQAGGDQVLKFVNLIDLDKFEFEFKPGVVDNYTSLKVVLTDAYNDRNKVEIKYQIEGTGYAVEMAGQRVFINKQYDTANTICSLRYSSASEIMIVDEEQISYGFETFTSNLCHLDVVLEKVSSPSQITIEKVGNHVFRGTKVLDDCEPIIDIVSSEGSYVIGTTITLNAPVFTDVISQIDTSANYVKIQHDDGTVINVENVNSTYDLKLDKLGSYTIIYGTSDMNGNGTNHRYVITVVDREAPVITLNNYVEDTIVLVECFKVFKLDYSVSDNLTDAENIQVHLTMENLANGERIYPGSKTEVPCTMEGDFVIRIVAVDEYMNYSSKEVYIRVQGGK